MPVGAMPARSISLVGTVGLLPTFSPAIVPLNPEAPGRKVCQLQGAGVARNVTLFPAATVPSIWDCRATVLDLHSSDGVGGNVASDIQVSAKCFKGSGSRDWASEGAETDKAGI
jgi:hypothetical protein